MPCRARKGGAEFLSQAKASTRLELHRYFCQLQNYLDKISKRGTLNFSR